MRERVLTFDAERLGIVHALLQGRVPGLTDKDGALMLGSDVHLEDVGGDVAAVVAARDLLVGALQPLAIVPPEDAGSGIAATALTRQHGLLAGLGLLRLHRDVHGARLEQDPQGDTGGLGFGGSRVGGLAAVLEAVVSAVGDEDELGLGVVGAAFALDGARALDLLAALEPREVGEGISRHGDASESFELSLLQDGPL